MAFIIVFVVTMLVVPILIDYRKHPEDPILKKNARELVRNIPIIGLASFLQKFGQRTREMIVGLVSILIVVISLLVITKVIGFAVSFLFGSDG